MGNIGFSELVVIFAIALLLFGGKKLPEVGRSIGQAIREFKRSMTGAADEEEKAEKPTSESPTKPT